MDAIIFDTEVFAADWLIVCKRAGGDFECVVHNDCEAFKLYYAQRSSVPFVGFNTKHYDDYIVRAVLGGATPAEVKSVNDYILAGNEGWRHGFFHRADRSEAAISAVNDAMDNARFGWKGDDAFTRRRRTEFQSVDLMDDTLQGTSLKSIEGHLGLDIEESEVDFKIGRALDREELKETISYCKADVEATERLFNLRGDYLQTKVNLGARVGIGPKESMRMTNAQLTAKILHAERREHDDAREYVYPPNLDLDAIPKDILTFFDGIHDMSIPDEDFFSRSHEEVIAGVTCNYGWGGVHGSVERRHIKAEGGRLIFNKDVSSLYPSLIELYDYLSRNVPDKKLFCDLRRERLEAKKRGDKQLAKDLKLPLNTVSGAQENRYNDLYDPKPTKSLRISGELFITDLVEHLLSACPSMELLNLNTDGVMYSINERDEEASEATARAWMERTGFELETTVIEEAFIKDVNNIYAKVRESDGSMRDKKVGAYLNYGISANGAWSINNNFVAVKKALFEYLKNGVPPEETIRGDKDIFDFQFIAKSSSKYSDVYRLVGSAKMPCQKCNRVYASKDKRDGTLYHTNLARGNAVKMPSLPDHCIVDNSNGLSTEDIDLDFYIDMAYKYIEDFTGESPKAKNFYTEDLISMADATKATATTAPKKGGGEPDVKAMNVYERLLNARYAIRSSGMEKSGRHLKPNFMYFTLDDIVPKVTEACMKFRIFVRTTFNPETAEATVVDIDDTTQVIKFDCPVQQLASIETREGAAITNAMQNIGSMQTYARRYLYLLVFDIAEYDAIDGDEGEEVALSDKPHSAAPKTSEERKEIVEKLTASPSGSMASAQKLETIKRGCKKWRELDPTADEQVQKIVLQTNSFTEATNEVADQLLKFLASKTKEAKA